MSDLVFLYITDAIGARPTVSKNTTGFLRRYSHSVKVIVCSHIRPLPSTPMHLHRVATTPGLTSSIGAICMRINRSPQPLSRKYCGVVSTGNEIDSGFATTTSRARNLEPRRCPIQCSKAGIFAKVNMGLHAAAKQPVVVKPDSTLTQ